MKWIIIDITANLFLNETGAFYVCQIDFILITFIYYY